MCFLTNKTDAQFIRSQKGQSRIAQGMAHGILAYLGGGGASHPARPVARVPSAVSVTTPKSAPADSEVAPGKPTVLTVDPPSGSTVRGRVHIRIQGPLRRGAFVTFRLPNTTSITNVGNSTEWDSTKVGDGRHRFRVTVNNNDGTPEISLEVIYVVRNP